MLSTLSVRNIVLIDQLDIGLGSGLTVLTGETGAGKSILLDALTLALGGRGDAALVRAGSDSGQVVAVFHLAADHPARVVLRDNAIEDDEEIILRRVQFADGRTKAFVNDQPVSAGLLRTVGGTIVEIHGQHDERALIDSTTHRDLLDAFGGHEPLVLAVERAHDTLVTADRDVADQRRAIDEARAREEFARHVVEELSALAPVAGEEETLAIERQRLMQLEKAADDVAGADEVLNGAMAPGPALSQLLRRLGRKVEFGADLFRPLVDTLDAALVALDATGEALEQLKREMGFDPLELERVEERLFALRAAARKHQCSADDLVAVLARYQGELEALEGGEERLAVLVAEAAKARSGYVAASEKLAAARAKAASSLRKAVDRELPELRLGAAKFLVDLESDPDRVAPSGFDQVAFHVQTNPGTPAGPLLKVASGGELSRFLLALKVVLADRGSAPVLIFDEIDTGVGGAVADAIGLRLARLASGVQVIAVTHAPQVAARAGRHMLIEKREVAKGAFVRTSVTPLEGEGRREEIARMLAGAKITEEARAAASRLIAEVE